MSCQLVQVWEFR
jgi:hypothetical protein